MKILGLDIGGSKITIVSSEIINGEPIIEKKLLFDTPNTHNEIIESIIYNMHKIYDEDIDAIGISIGGPLDSKKGMIISPPHLKELHNFNLKEFIGSHFNKPIYMKNDANAGALVEFLWGNAKGYDNVIFCTFGTGMGAGFIFDRRLYEGKNDMAGEIGHMWIADEGIEFYGKMGAYELFSSGAGITKYVENELSNTQEDTILRKYESLDTKIIFECYKCEDTFTVRVLNRALYLFSKGISNLIDILNPEIIILGSLYSRQKDVIDSMLLPMLEKEPLLISRDNCIIKEAKYKEKIGDYAPVAIAYYCHLNEEKNEI